MAYRQRSRSGEVHKRADVAAHRGGNQCAVHRHCARIGVDAECQMMPDPQGEGGIKGGSINKLGAVEKALPGVIRHRMRHQNEVLWQAADRLPNVWSKAKRLLGHQMA